MRNELRKTTREAHDRLDQLASGLPVVSRATYIAFLQAQGRARLAAESAFRHTTPTHLVRPPVQGHLIRTDLEELGVQLQPAGMVLTFASSCEALGAAWVIAGSSLGNRAMLVQRQKAGLSGAERFLSDPRMPAYFKDVLVALEEPRDARSQRDVLSGAHNCFSLFERAFAALPESLAA